MAHNADTTDTGTAVDPTAASAPTAAGRRIFVIEGNEYPDELPGLSVDQVRQHFANWHTDLHNAEVGEAKRGADTIYTFRKRIGTKGAPPASIAAGMADGPAGDAAGPPAPASSVRDLLFAALAAVPAKHLRIWPLARDLYRGGELDIDAANARADEFALATDEIRAVTAGTRRVNGALERWMDAA